MEQLAKVRPLALGVVVPAVAAAGLIPLRKVVAPSNLAMVVMLAVVGVATLGNRGGSAAAAVSGAAAFDLLLVEPYGSLAIHAPDDLFAVVVLLAAGFLVGALADRLRTQHLTRAAREDELGRLYHVAELAAHATPIDRLGQVVAHEIRDLLALRSCTFEPHPDDHPVALIDHEGIVRLGDLEWDVEHNGLPGGPLAIELRNAGWLQAQFRLDPVPGTRVEPYQLLVAVALADQVAAAARVSNLSVLSAN